MEPKELAVEIYQQSLKRKLDEQANWLVDFFPRYFRPAGGAEVTIVDPEVSFGRDYVRAIRIVPKKRLLSCIRFCYLVAIPGSSTIWRFDLKGERFLTLRYRHEFRESIAASLKAVLVEEG